MTAETQPEQKTSKLLDPKANVKVLVRIVVIVAILLGGVWLFIRFTAGEKAANRVISTVLRQRVSLVDTIEDLPASSFKALPLSLPYTGTLSIELAVRRGNDISVYVVRPDQRKIWGQAFVLTYFKERGRCQACVIAFLA